MNEKIKKLLKTPVNKKLYCFFHLFLILMVLFLFIVFLAKESFYVDVHVFLVVLYSCVITYALSIIDFSLFFNPEKLEARIKELEKEKEQQNEHTNNDSSI